MNTCISLKFKIYWMLCGVCLDETWVLHETVSKPLNALCCCWTIKRVPTLVLDTQSQSEFAQVKILKNSYRNKMANKIAIYLMVVLIQLVIFSGKYIIIWLMYIIKHFLFYYKIWTVAVAVLRILGARVKLRLVGTL